MALFLSLSVSLCLCNRGSAELDPNQECSCVPLRCFADKRPLDRWSRLLSLSASAFSFPGGRRRKSRSLAHDRDAWKPDGKLPVFGGAISRWLLGGVSRIRGFAQSRIDDQAATNGQSYREKIRASKPNREKAPQSPSCGGWFRRRDKGTETEAEFTGTPRPRAEITADSRPEEGESPFRSLQWIPPANIGLYNRLVSLSEKIYCMRTFWEQKYTTGLYNRLVSLSVVSLTGIQGSFLVPGLWKPVLFSPQHNVCL